jgi:cell division inhibitor SepF
MAGIWDKITGVFFTEDEDYDEEEIVEETPKQQKRDVWTEEQPSSRRSRRSQIVSMPNTATRKSMEMVLVKAKAYDDMQSIANNIKARKVVIVNFEDMDKETAQRMVDFLSGAVFALDGMPKKVSGSTFLFSSSQVDLEGQIMEAEAQTAFDSMNDYNIWKK